MIKANAYGHGDVEVAQVLESAGVGAMGVVTVEEGGSLRQAGVRSQLLVFGLFDERSVEQVIKHNLTPVLSSWEHIDCLSLHLTDGQRYPVHLKFNTGMNRLGFEVSECSRLVDYFRNQTQIRVQGICTHFVNSEDAGDPSGLSRQQLLKFVDVEKAFVELDPTVHVSNSASLLRGAQPESGAPLSSRQGLGARPGLALYGMSPSRASAASLLPVMEVKSSLGLIRSVKRGESVSYGARWVAKRDSWVGVVPLGYADGYPRLLSGRGQMALAGQLAPVIGAVCMDYTMIDLTDIIEAEVLSIGDEVIVMGESRGARESVRIGAHDIAEICGTIPYEILTGFSARLPRVFLGGAS